MAQLKEKCIGYLREEGYCPNVDNDGDVMFKVQGATLFLMDDENDETFLKIWLPQFWSLDDDQERAKAHFVSNKLNKEYKCGKIFLHNDNTHAVCELFVDENSAVLKETIMRCLNILTSMRGEFKVLMQG